MTMTAVMLMMMLPMGDLRSGGERESKPGHHQRPIVERENSRMIRTTIRRRARFSGFWLASKRYSMAWRELVGTHRAESVVFSNRERLAVCGWSMRFPPTHKLVESDCVRLVFVIILLVLFSETIRSRLMI